MYFKNQSLCQLFLKHNNKNIQVNNNILFCITESSGPNIAIIGKLQSGKSTLANLLVTGQVSYSCKNCDFPVCSGMGFLCTKETSYTSGNWLGTGDNVTVIDTPGFDLLDEDYNMLLDDMITVLQGISCQRDHFEKAAVGSGLNIL